MDKEIAQLRDMRIGAGATCANCFHAYKMRANPTDIAPALVCVEGPPLIQMIGTPQGPALQSLPRVVSVETFCHRWKAALVS
jgi:hypothetical protein